MNTEGQPIDVDFTAKISDDDTDAKPPKTEGELDDSILNKMEAATEESALTDFKNKLAPEKLSVFEKETNDHDKITCIAISNMDNEELAHLTKNAATKGYLPGFHEVGNYLGLLFNLTGDRRYLDVAQPHIDNMKKKIDEHRQHH